MKVIPQSLRFPVPLVTALLFTTFTAPPACLAFVVTPTSPTLGIGRLFLPPGSSALVRGRSYDATRRPAVGYFDRRFRVEEANNRFGLPGQDSSRRETAASLSLRMGVDESDGGGLKGGDFPGEVFGWPYYCNV